MTSSPLCNVVSSAKLSSRPSSRSQRIRSKLYRDASNVEYTVSAAYWFAVEKRRLLTIRLEETRNAL